MTETIIRKKSKEEIQNDDFLYNQKIPNNIKAILKQFVKHDSPAPSTIVFRRAVDGIAKTVDALNPEVLTEIASMRTEIDVLVSIIDAATKILIPEISTKNQLAELCFEGIKTRRELLSREGGVISSQKVAEILGISRQAVDKRRKSGKLIAVALAKREYSYPVWQFTENGVLPGLDKVLEALKHYDPWMKIIFMLNKNDLLDKKTPLEKLREGKAEDVIKSARVTEDQGAR